MSNRIPARIVDLWSRAPSQFAPTANDLYQFEVNKRAVGKVIGSSLYLITQAKATNCKFQVEQNIKLQIWLWIGEYNCF
jgi:hypothetical protein